MQMPEQPIIQRKCAHCQEEEEQIHLRPSDPFIQRKEQAVSDSTTAAINSSRGGGNELPANTRRFMENGMQADFSQVRIHHDAEAAALSRDLQAQAFTVGNDIYFNEGKYEPETASGKHLLAHELAHTLQQSGGAARKVQRFIDEPQLAATPAADIMRDDNYIDNNIKSLTYWAGEQATIHYNDGTDLLIGLVPDWVKPPLEGIDYHTVRSEHAQMVPEPGQTGSVDFVPNVRKIKPAPGMSAQDVIQFARQRATFHVDAASRRIMPTIINSVTAPILCETLRTAEVEWIKQFDAVAKGMVQILEKLKTIIILRGFLPSGAPGTLGTGGGSGTLGRGAGRIGSGAGAATVDAVSARAIPKLLQFFTKLIANPGVEDSIAVEGVNFGGVKATVEGTTLRITRLSIENTLRGTAQGKGLGRLMAAAFEQAAIQAARQAGLSAARVSVSTVVNAAWGTYLQSIGYEIEIVATQTGFTKLWTKVLTL